MKEFDQEDYKRYVAHFNRVRMLASTAAMLVFSLRGIRDSAVPSDSSPDEAIRMAKIKEGAEVMLPLAESLIKMGAEGREASAEMEAGLIELDELHNEYMGVAKDLVKGWME